MNSKKNILVFSDWYLPAYKAGGPVRSLAALAFHLKDKYNFFIVTSNKDAFSEQPLPVKANEWLTLTNGEKVFYATEENLAKKKIPEIINAIDHDYIYLNSFFSKHFSIVPLRLKKENKIKKPVVLAPRGMLGKGALSLKPLKKKIFIQVAKTIGLHKNIIWHATSVQEAEEIKKIIGKNADVRLAANLTLPPSSIRSDYSKTPGELNICFISRISKKKNLLFALETLKEIATGKIIFDVYGPDEEKTYLEECVSLAKKLPQNIIVNFKGAILPTQVEKTLQQYHAFYLPTLNENFGHAIIEAMLNGCIPLISDQTPWRNLEEKGLGWDLPLGDKSRFIKALEGLISMDKKSFETQSIKIQQFARENSSDPATLKAYEQLFK